MPRALIEVSGLSVSFPSRTGDVIAADGVSFWVDAGETVGIVGESGSGKSVTALAVLGLLDQAGRVERGSVRFKGRELQGASREELRAIRGRGIAMVFQQPIPSLNPSARVGRQLAEVFAVYYGLRRRAAWDRAVEALRAVEIPDPERSARAYAHQLSGGQAQRVMLALALAGQPELLIADEPTSSLDVTIQAQILDLLRELQRARQMAVVLISHDLGVIAETCDRLVVMYAAQVVESGTTQEVLLDPKHPYTQALIRSTPVIGQRAARLNAIEGRVPVLVDPPAACRFAPRCQVRTEFDVRGCNDTSPSLHDLGGGRAARCLLYDDATQRSSVGDDRAP